MQSEIDEQNLYIMKKTILFLFAALFVSFAVNAQSLSLSNEDGPIADGGDIYVYSDDPLVTDIIAHVYVTNNSSSTLNVKVYRDQISMVENSWSQFCWFVCFAPNMDTSSTVIAIEPGATNEGDFSGHYWPMGNPGESIVAYTFYDEANMDDNVTVNVHYKLSLTGLEEYLADNTSFSSAYPNPADNFVSFDYDIPSEVNNARIIITNLLGAVVYETTLENYNGTARIDVASLTEGIYFATLKLDNYIAETQKVLVQ